MHGCTITSAGYWSHARVLADSFLASNPHARLWVLSVDGSREAMPGGERVQMLAPGDVGVDDRELQRRATMYTPQTVAQSMKPNLLASVLDRAPGPVIFFDADACVYDDLDCVAELAETHSLVLSPQTLDPNPLARPEDSAEEIALRTGIYNSGFVAVGPGAEPFLDWWAGHTGRRCVWDWSCQRMLDQPWLVLASTLFDHHVLKDRGCNVAGWNLHARDVHWVGDRPTIDGGPLRHFHFACGYDPERPELLARDQKYWPTLAGRPGVARLSREYARRLLDNGYVQERMRPVQGVAMLSGAPIEPWMRVVYRSALINAEQNGGVEPPNPFAHGEEHFSAWIRDRAVPTVDALMKGGASAWPEAGAPDLQAFELVAAMARVRELAPRIGELEAIRDDAIAWAQREADRSRAAAAERDALARQLEDARAVMTSVWNSPSWRLTRPLRGAKASVMGLRSRRRHPDVGSVSETRQAT